MARSMASIRLTLKQAAILFFIYKEGGQTYMSKLRREVNAYSSDIELLRKKYLIDVEWDGLVKLTELGREVIEKNKEKFEEIYKIRQECGNNEVCFPPRVYVDFPI